MKATRDVYHPWPSGQGNGEDTAERQQGDGGASPHFSAWIEAVCTSPGPDRVERLARMAME